MLGDNFFIWLSLRNLQTFQAEYCGTTPLCFQHPQFYSPNHAASTPSLQPNEVLSQKCHQWLLCIGVSFIIIQLLIIVLSYWMLNDISIFLSFVWYLMTPPLSIHWPLLFIDIETGENNLQMTRFGPYLMQYVLFLSKFWWKSCAFLDWLSSLVQTVWLEAQCKTIQFAPTNNFQN